MTRTNLPAWERQRIIPFLSLYTSSKLERVILMVGMQMISVVVRLIEPDKYEYISLAEKAMV